MITKGKRNYTWERTANKKKRKRKRKWSINEEELVSNGENLAEILNHSFLDVISIGE